MIIINGKEWKDEFNAMPLDILERTVKSIAKLPKIICKEFTGLSTVHYIASEVYDERLKTEDKMTMAKLKKISDSTGQIIKITHDGISSVPKLSSEM